MIKLIICKLVSLGAIAGMSAIVYFDSYEYLNVVTIYFSLILLMYAIMIPIAGACLLASNHGKDARNVCKMFDDMIKTKAGFRGFAYYVESIVKITLLSMLGYTLIVVLYVVAIALYITIANKAKMWVKEYRDEVAIENKAIIDIVLKSMKDKEDGKVMTSKALHDRLAKMKEDLKC